jgi:hypothetical protein
MLTKTGQGGGMIRYLALLSLAATTSLDAATLPRSFSVTSFDRIRVEAPFAVALATGSAPFARAEGPSAALDLIDLRVEGRTLIIRQRSGWNGKGMGVPVKISVGTPDIRSATLMGSGSLAIDRLKGLSVEVSVAGPGSLSVGKVAADRLNGGIQGSGSLLLAGQVKAASLSARGSPTLSAAALQADELSLAAEGTGEVEANVRSRATVSAAGTMQVRLSGGPACILKVSGSASVEGCKSTR